VVGKLDYLDEHYGFRSFRFGAQVSQFSGLVPTVFEEGIREAATPEDAVYIRQSEDLQIVEGELKSIVYYFRNNIFTGVFIKSSGMTNARALMRTLINLYGDPGRDRCANFNARLICLWAGVKVAANYSRQENGETSLMIAAADLLKDSEFKNKEVESSSASIKKNSPEPQVYTTAYQLYRKYQENEVAADEEYKDKLVEFSGIVDSIRKDDRGEILLMLQGKDKGVLDLVQCALAEGGGVNKADLTHKAAALKKGDIVTLRGKVVGKRILNVDIVDCIFVEKLSSVE
jgi:hypothetical protein